MNGIWQDNIGELIEDKVDRVKRQDSKFMVLWIEVIAYYETTVLKPNHTPEEYSDLLDRFKYTPIEEVQSIRIMMTEGLDFHFGILGFLTDYDNMPDWKEIDTRPPSDD